MTESLSQGIFAAICRLVDALQESAIFTIHNLGIIMSNGVGSLPSLSLKVQPTTVQRGAVENLRAAVLAGTFKPGDRLVEANLCDLLGISRASVREALRSLEAEKLIEIVPNRGPFVRMLSWEEAEQIYQARAILEGEAARLFVGRANPSNLAALKSALADFEAAVEREDVVARVTETGRFYEIILEGCGNRIIQELLNGLMARITFLRHRSMSRAGRARESIEEMRRLVVAIESRKRRDASRAAVDHVIRACEAAKAVYGSDQATVSSAKS